MTTIANNIVRDSGIIFRGVLYFLIAALPVLVDGLKDSANGGPSPTTWKIIWLVLSALIPGLTALRAFYDGSAQRHQDELASTPKTP